jgi:DNA-binding GntR family transcriptional regulator
MHLDEIHYIKPDRSGMRRLVATVNDGFETKTDWVVSKLRSTIRAGELAPGERVRTGVWAERYGVSETPMREAVKILAAEGLLTIEPHKGAHVTALSSEDFREFCHVLGSLESAAIRLACEKLSEVDRRRAAQELRKILQNMSAALIEADFSTLLRLNRAFHTSFDRFADSMILLTALSPLRDLFPIADKALVEAILASKARSRDLMRDYNGVVRAFEAGDSAGAVDAMAKHVVWVLGNLQSVELERAFPARQADRPA